MRSKRAHTIRRRLQGVAFLVVLAALLGLSVAFYNKAFTDVATVTLKTDTVGNQLQEASDVKVRGVIVGVLISIPDAIVTKAYTPILATGVIGSAIIGALAP